MCKDVESVQRCWKVCEDVDKASSSLEAASRRKNGKMEKGREGGERGMNPTMIE